MLENARDNLKVLHPHLALTKLRLTSIKHLTLTTSNKQRTVFTRVKHLLALVLNETLWEDIVTKETQLKVEAIKNGTVIDHIPANIGIKALKLFDMHNSNQRVTIGLNLPSSALGGKDLLKIECVYHRRTSEQAGSLCTSRDR